MQDNQPNGDHRSDTINSLDINRKIKMSSNHPLVMHRFSNAGDVERLFQAELDKLPRKDGRPVITEFGGVMVGAGDSLVHRLTHNSVSKSYA